MRNRVNMPAGPPAFGKGVFQPSRAPIAAEMERRLRLGSSDSRQGRLRRRLPPRG